MRIFINGRFLTQRTTGIQRFAYQMCLALFRKNVHFEVVMPDSPATVSDIPFNIIKYGKHSSPLWEQIWLPLFLRKYPDALLISFSGLGPMFRKSHISTIHDLSFYVNKRWFSTAYRLMYGTTTPIMAKHCKGLITVSEFSKKEIVRFLDVDPDKIHVIYNAVSESFTKEGDNSTVQDSRFNEKYLLAVSSLDPRKNFNALIEAFRKADLPDYKLYIIGGRQASFAGGSLEGKEDDRVKYLGHVDDAVLKQAYRGASLFVYPSLYEGFGIPPIEAMSLSCPVLVSDIDVFKEVYADAAWYCNPNDTDDIASKMEMILNPSNTAKVKLKREAGLLQCQKYSWDSSAEKLIQEFNLI